MINRMISLRRLMVAIKRRTRAEHLVHNALARLRIYMTEVQLDQNSCQTLCADAFDALEPSPVSASEMRDHKAISAAENCADEARHVAMWQTIRSLEPNAQDAFLLHRLNRFTHAEISSRLNIPVDEVEAHVSAVVTALALHRQEARRNGVRNPSKQKGC